MDRTIGILAVLGIVAAGVVTVAVYDESQKEKCAQAGGTWQGLFKSPHCVSGVNQAEQNCLGTGGTWNSSTGTCTCPSGYTLDSTGRCVAVAPTPTPTALSPPAYVQVTNVQVPGPDDWTATVNCPGSSGATGYKIFDNDQLLGTTTSFPATIHAHAPGQAHDIGVEACN